MNIKFLTLSIVTVAGIAGTVSPAQAQGARFQYEPNVWGSEVHARRAASRNPQVAPHSVMPGAMPRSSNFLGVSPNFLTKPQAPKPILVPETVVVARPTVPQPVQPQVPIVAQQQQLTPFNSLFGKPTSPVTQQPAAQSAPAAQQLPASKSVAAHHRPTHRATNNLRGKLLPRKQAVPAVATPQIANYGNQFYASGSGVNGVGTHSTATVSGTVIKRK